MKVLDDVNHLNRRSNPLHEDVRTASERLNNGAGKVSQERAIFDQYVADCLIDLLLVHALVHEMIVEEQQLNVVLVSGDHLSHAILHMAMNAIPVCVQHRVGNVTASPVNAEVDHFGHREALQDLLCSDGLDGNKSVIVRMESHPIPKQLTPSCGPHPSSPDQ